MGTGFEDRWEHTEPEKPLAVRMSDGVDFIDNTLIHGAVSITNATIEQTTGDAHNDLNIAVAGKGYNGKVYPLTSFVPVIYDSQVIDESLAPATTVITYKLGVTTKATKTITVSGTTTTITVVIA